MPYISQPDRRALDRDVRINNDLPMALDAGELNYLITRLVDRYIENEGLSYRTLNEAIGVLECAKLELYRRIAAPYEDTKIEENGDVYTVAPTTQERDE